MAKKNAKQAAGKPQAPQKPQKMSKARLQILIVMTVIVAGMFMPTTILILIGMLPTFVSLMVEKKETKIRSLTVGSMNFAGCSPFLLELWLNGHNFENSFGILLDPLAIITMYLCAGMGYSIDWGSTTLMTNVLYDLALKRKDAIEKRQEELILRWGEKVAGQIELDREGFPKE